MHLVEVAFKGNRKEFFSWEGEGPPPVHSSVVVEADRGEDLGIVNAIGALAEKRCAGCAHGVGAAAPTRRAIRIASTHDLRQAKDLRAQDEVARQKGMERVKAHGLVMKLSDAEWQWDRKKLTFYFTAEKRVDFRNLVRDLAALFRARIELKQIGVRDEAKRLDGVGRCGRQFCSASWLPELRPVNLGVAKDQRLSLNPSQISGACGRLMCCLRYEHEFYVQSRKRFPKDGKILVTARGEEKVMSNDIFNERVTLRSSEGEIRVVPLAQLRRDLAAAGHPLAGGTDPRDELRADDGAIGDLVTDDLPTNIPDGSIQGLASLLDERDPEFDRETLEGAEFDDTIETVLERESDLDDSMGAQWSSTMTPEPSATPPPTQRVGGQAKDSPRPRVRRQHTAQQNNAPVRPADPGRVAPPASPSQGPTGTPDDVDPDDAGPDIVGPDLRGAGDVISQSGGPRRAETADGEGPGHERAGAGGPRRRRGRRGGRRGRGKSGAGTPDGDAPLMGSAPGAWASTVPPVSDADGPDNEPAPSSDD